CLAGSFFATYPVTRALPYGPHSIAQPLACFPLLSMLLLPQVLGGQFRRVMPSDLRYPGAFAKGSMPTTRSAKDDSTAYLQHGPNRVLLEKMLIKDGCHSCGAY
ncbi:hypothetical protein DUNSADRAFT_6713, partial [Dunaliella salina]